jgi:hypothetical protein
VSDGTWRTRDSHLEEVRCGALAGCDILAGSDCPEMTDANYMISSEAGRSLTQSRESVDCRPCREGRDSTRGLWRNAGGCQLRSARGKSGTCLDGVSAVIDIGKSDFADVGPAIVSRLMGLDAPGLERAASFQSSCDVVLSDGRARMETEEGRPCRCEFRTKKVEGATLLTSSFCPFDS